MLYCSTSLNTQTGEHLPLRPPWTPSWTLIHLHPPVWTQSLASNGWQCPQGKHKLPVALTSTIMSVFGEAGPGSAHNLSTYWTPSNSPTTKTAVGRMPSPLCYTCKTYVRMLFINSSVFIIIITSKLMSKLINLGINTSICSWMLDFRTNRPQYVRLDTHTSSTLTLNSRCPLVPLHLRLRPYTWFHYHYQFCRWHIVKNSESADWDEVQQLAMRCSSNSLGLNTKNTKEPTVDFRKTESGTHTSIRINGMKVVSGCLHLRRLL